MTRTRVHPLAWVVVAVVAVVAFGPIWLPYYGDQALYAVIGREVVAGHVPYTGIWDIKQPGVYLWYGLLAAVGGTATWVTRLADVLVLLGTCALLHPLLRGRVSPAVARWTPVVTALVVLLGARPLDLGQVEQLMCLPATGALVLALRRGRGALVAAGVLVGVVAVFKLWLAAVPAVAVLVVLLRSRRRAPDGPIREVSLVALGALVPLGAVLLWLGAAGALPTALETWFVYPAQALALDEARPLSRLVSGAGRFALLSAVLVLPAAAHLPRVWRERDPLDLACVAWLVTGVAVLLTQLWWSYHWVTLVPALALLAARHVDRARRPAPLALAAIPLVVVALLTGPLHLGGGLTAGSRAAMTDELSSAPVVRAELAAVGPVDSLHVLGDPTYHLLADRPIALRLNGWTPELFTADQWADLAGDLRTAHPRAVFVENVHVGLTAERGAAFQAVLDADYDLVRTSAAGDWYRLR